jgi:tetratricopeptide (TPR) repeat protein
VARLLVATSVTDDPELAFKYAKKARGLAARVGVVRETCAIAAYQAGDWSAALAEFRAARRLTGRSSYLPLMADCERALGRLDRALDLVTGEESKSADQQTRIELRIVESGIRRDQGLLDAAVVALQIPELNDGRMKPAYARLYYAYADALLQAGREDEARDWFGRAASADVDGDTDAAERCDELDDISMDDLELDDDFGADEDDDSAEADEDLDDDALDSEDDLDSEDVDSEKVDNDEEVDGDEELDGDEEVDGDEEADGDDDDLDSEDDEVAEDDHEAEDDEVNPQS